MKHLSIIIPMYNVEPYVERCIRSLEDQDIPGDDYEIICINDGSPDNSKEIVVRLCKEYDNIILIDQENQGVSRARNNGIDRACGAYLLFIDPDDYMVTNSLGQVLKTSDEQNAQVSFLGYTSLNTDDRIHKEIIYSEYEGKVFPGIEAYYLSRGDGETDPDRMWAVLFRKKFLDHNNLRYLPDVPYLEDGEFIARILCLAERCIFIGHSFYKRTARLGSATHSNLFHSEKATKGFVLAATNLKKFQQEKNLNEKQKRFLNQPIVHFINLVTISGGKPVNFRRMRNLKKKLIESGLGKVNLDSVIKEYTKRGYLYNKSIYLLFIYQFLTNGLHSLRLRLKKMCL